MEDDTPRCHTCGEYATHALGESTGIVLCDNVVCYQAAIELIKEKLEEAKGE